MEDAVQRIYEAVLARGEAGSEDYYAALRRRGIAATNDDEAGHLYAPNPVVVPRSLVEAMTADVLRFAEARRADVTASEDLLETLPMRLRETFSSADVARRLVEDLAEGHPFICLDAYLVHEADGRIGARYLEWQTFPAYPTVALQALGALREAHPGLEAAGASFSTTGESLEETSGRVRGTLLEGTDDPRTAVLLDFDPWQQETRREFRFARELTGGERDGMGVLDPREIRYIDGRPTYRRDDRDIPIHAAFSRLVHDDMERLQSAATPDEREALTRFFGDPDVRWRVHPLHFHYGTKGDFPGFHAAGLSPSLVPCRRVDDDMIREEGPERLTGWVQKPVEGSGGREIVVDPRRDELCSGALLQETIVPAAVHRTLFGSRAPEVRVMALPDEAGGLYCSSVFTRVKAPDEFRSNAGVTARRNAPGTGEGYAVIALEA